MIRRVILLRLTAEHRPERSELGQRVLELLRSRPMVAGAEVGVWQPELEAEHPGWDLAVCVDFRDEHALAAYGEDAVHAAFVREELAPRVSARQVFVMQRVAASGQS
jgi:hypothetical protein